MRASVLAFILGLGVILAAASSAAEVQRGDLTASVTIGGGMTTVVSLYGDEGSKSAIGVAPLSFSIGKALSANVDALFLAVATTGPWGGCFDLPCGARGAAYAGAFRVWSRGQTAYFLAGLGLSASSYMRSNRPLFSALFGVVEPLFADEPRYGIALVAGVGITPYRRGRHALEIAVDFTFHAPVSGDDGSGLSMWGLALRAGWSFR